MFSKKSNIAFVGAGKIAYSICSALLNTGYNVSCVISRNRDSAKSFAKKFNIPTWSDNLHSLPEEITIFFLTVPDSEIKKSAETISKLKADFKNTLFIHVSGALSIKELLYLKKKKAAVASFHIMQTFPSKKIVDLKNSPVAIESDEKSVTDYLIKIAENLKLKPFKISSDKKIFYHLAGVYASNFIVGNLYLAEKLFEKTGVENFFSVYETTINSTLGNIKSSGAAEALSGPVERGDYETVAKHLKVLKENDKEAYLNYLIQSLNLLEVSKRKYRRLNKDHERVRKLLISELKDFKSG